MENQNKENKNEKIEEEEEKEHLFFKGCLIFLSFLLIISLIATLISYFLRLALLDQPINQEQLNEIVSSFTYEESDYLSFNMKSETEYKLVIDKSNSSLVEEEIDEGVKVTTRINFSSYSLYIDDLLISENEDEVNDAYQSIKNDVYTKYLRFDSSLKDVGFGDKHYFYDETKKELKVCSPDDDYLLYNEKGLLIEGKVNLKVTTTLFASYNK